MLIVLMPSPLALGHGMIMGSWWIQLLTMHVLIITYSSIERKEFRILVCIFILLTCVSNPVGFSGAATLLVAAKIQKIGVLRALHIFIPISIGGVMNLLANRRGMALLDFFPSGWIPNTRIENFVLATLIDSGAADARRVVAIDLVAKLVQVPGMIKYFFIQFWPEPLRAFLTDSTNDFVSIAAVVLPVATAIAFLTCANTKAPHLRELQIQLVYGGIWTTCASWLLVQDPYHFQYIVPMAQTALAAGAVGFTMQNGMPRIRYGPATVLLVVGFLGFSISVIQGFQDVGRNSHEVTWSLAVRHTVEECRKLRDTEVVVISQFTSDAGASLPQVVVRCKDLRSS